MRESGAIDAAFVSYEGRDRALAATAPAAVPSTIDWERASTVPTRDRPRHARTTDKRPQSPPKPPGQRRSKLVVIFTVTISALLVVGMLELALVGIFAGDDQGGAQNMEITLPVTPGSQEQEMRERLQTNPDDVNAMVILAGLLANSGQGQEAIQWYRKAVDARPDDAALRIAFGQTLATAGFTLDAELQYERAIALEPTNPQPVFLLGQLYQYARPPQPDKAREQYEQVIEMAPDSPYATQAQERLDQMAAES